MSFTSEIKKQLLNIEEKSGACKRAEFYAVYMMTGGYLRTANRDFAQRVTHLCIRSGGVPERIAFRGGPTGKASYMVGMRWSGHFSLEGEREAAAFLRGCFQVSGYVTEPQKPAHLEILFRDEVCYELCMAAFELAGIYVKGTLRENKFVLYMKDSDEITAFLAKTGAVKGVLEYENARILKQCNKESNRVTNCDDANINKAIEAGLRQKVRIEQFMKMAAFEELPAAIRETARLRAENPELSLTELGNLMQPPMSKAGVAHRLKKLEQLMQTI